MKKNKKPENPNAFPYVMPGDEKKGWDADVHEGMSLRDHFAGLAMQALITHYGLEGTKKTLTETSYELADTMLEERSINN